MWWLGGRQRQGQGHKAKMDFLPVTASHLRCRRGFGVCSGMCTEAQSLSTRGISIRHSMMTLPHTRFKKPSKNGSRPQQCPQRSQNSSRFLAICIFFWSSSRSQDKAHGKMIVLAQKAQRQQVSPVTTKVVGLRNIKHNKRFIWMLKYRWGKCLCHASHTKGEPVAPGLRAVPDKPHVGIWAQDLRVHCIKLVKHVRTHFLIWHSVARHPSHPKQGSLIHPALATIPCASRPVPAPLKTEGSRWRGTNSHCPAASPRGDEANISSSCQQAPGVKLEANFWRKRTVPQRPENAILVSERPQANEVWRWRNPTSSHGKTNYPLW